MAESQLLFVPGYGFAMASSNFSPDDAAPAVPAPARRVRWWHRVRYNGNLGPLPPAVRTIAAGRAGRPLAWAKTASNEWLVAGERGLLVGGLGAKFHPWFTIETATWDPQGNTIAVNYSAGGSNEWVTTDENRKLLNVLRDRIQNSVVTSQTIKVPGGKVHLAIRRTPEGLVSQITADPAVNTQTPEARELIDQAEQMLRSAAGLE